MNLDQKRLIVKLFDIPDQRWQYFEGFLKVLYLMIQSHQLCLNALSRKHECFNFITRIEPTCLRKVRFSALAHSMTSRQSAIWNFSDPWIFATASIKDLTTNHGLRRWTSSHTESLPILAVLAFGTVLKKGLTDWRCKHIRDEGMR